MVLTTNKPNSVRVEASDRLFIIINSETIPPREYFDRVGPLLNGDDNTVKHYYAYLMQYDLSKYDPKRIPDTAAKRELMSDSSPMEVKFLQALCMRRQMISMDKATDIYDGKGELNVNNEMTRCSPAGRILTEYQNSEIYVSIQSLHTAFKDYLLAYDRKHSCESDQGITRIIRRLFKTSHVGKVVRFDGKCTKTMVLPGTLQMQSQMEAAKVWDTHFTLELPTSCAYYSGLHDDVGVRMVSH